MGGSRTKVGEAGTTSTSSSKRACRRCEGGLNKLSFAAAWRARAATNAPGVKASSGARPGGWGAVDSEAAAALRRARACRASRRGSWPSTARPWRSSHPCPPAAPRRSARARDRQPAGAAAASCTGAHAGGDTDACTVQIRRRRRRGGSRPVQSSW
eukprot:5738186-Pleurochrysis_carterae.AAC.1